MGLKKIGKRTYLRSLASTLAISFSALILVALVIASGLQMIFSFQSQQKNLVTNQNLIAKNTANTVENFIHEKFMILETISRRGNLINIPGEEQKMKAILMASPIGIGLINNRLVLQN